MKRLPLAPVTRADCRDGQRPCPWLRCRWHTLHEEAVTTVGLQSSRSRAWRAIREKRILDRLTSGRDTCGLDVIERGGATWVDLSRILWRERTILWRISKKARDRLKVAE